MDSSSPPFKCPYDDCERLYSTKKILRRHIRAIHERESQFQCPNCGKPLSSGQNLREHMYIHTGAYPYVCEYPGCGARFRQGSQYCAHKRVHQRREREVRARQDILPISLTKLLVKNPSILDSPRTVRVEPPSPNTFALPTIKGSESMGPIPNEWLYNQLG